MKPTFSAGTLHIHREPAELAKVTAALRGVGRRICLVPTMGALHDGHRALIKAARRVPGAVVVVSIFVNPTQFGPDEDLGRYPRSFESDVEMCRAEGVELVFHPTAEAIYPHGDGRVTIDPGWLGDELEGAARPGHFAGVLTVVAKLFNIVRPDYAFFGEKDYQQLVLIRRMVEDLNIDVSVVGVPTVRDADGLALSSRNAYLDPDQRAAALALSAALVAGGCAADGGPEAVLAAASAVLDAAPQLVTDYLELRGADLAAKPASGLVRLLVAARVGNTRLIDNAAVALGGGDDTRHVGR